MFKICCVLLFAFFKQARSDAIAFQDCGSEYYLREVSIDGCSRIPCCLTMGAQHTIRMRMFASSSSAVLSQQVYLVLFGIHSGVNVTPYNPCAQIPCPISNSRNVSLNAVMNINSTLVPLNGYLNWTIRNERGATVVCMRTEIGLQYSGAPANACQRYRSFEVEETPE